MIEYDADKVRKVSPYISVDCVVFGFSTDELKVLVIERQYTNPDDGKRYSDVKLPGSLIYDDEDLYVAAVRVLNELTGLSDVYLQQFFTFGSPERSAKKADREWLLETKKVQIERIISTAYLALLDITRVDILETARWISLKDLDQYDFPFDHREIIEKGLDTLQKTIKTEPIAFELLPEKFPLRDLQSVYEVVLDRELDSRNFRKRISKARYIIPLNEKEVGVPHKPAQLFTFSRSLYAESKQEYLGFIL